jgi:hypothetical protein
MAVVTTKSAAITNRDSTPAVLNNARIEAGALKSAAGIVAIANGDSATSKLLFCQLPSNAVVRSVRVSSPDIGTTTAMDLGIYQTTQNGGAVVDADHFASALSLNGGALNKSEVANESAVYDVDDMEKPLWQALGLSADSQRMYDVVGTLTGAADAAGSVFVEVEYAI